MDYQSLAGDMLHKMYIINKARPQRKFNDCMRGEGFVLQYVIFREEPVQPSEISSFMNISTARMAAALNSLERKGLVTRRIDLSDRRKILVELTQEGKRLADMQRVGMLAHFTRLLELLGEQDATDLVRIAGRVADIITVTPPPSPDDSDFQALFSHGHHPWHQHRSDEL
jgi:MarR family transcriptional regulator, organic hydroperoxide resistance regulator